MTELVPSSPTVDVTGFLIRILVVDMVCGVFGELFELIIMTERLLIGPFALISCDMLSILMRLVFWVVGATEAVVDKEADFNCWPSPGAALLTIRYFFDKPAETFESIVTLLLLLTFYKVKFFRRCVKIKKNSKKIANGIHCYDFDCGINFCRRINESVRHWASGSCGGHCRIV